MPPEVVDHPLNDDKKDKSFLAKDGQYYCTYMEQRAANIRHNEAVLRAVGLDKFRLKRRNKTSPRRKPSRSVSQHEETPRRTSSRIRKQPAPASELPPSPPRTKVRRRARVVHKRRIHEENGDGNVLTAHDRQQLEGHADWLPEMEKYLQHVEHISHPNQRSVMRQVEKLVSGQGITYTHWNEGVYFGRGRTVALSDNFDQLYDEACAFEDEHGKDLGNGWLLRHPIKKLSNFQRYRLQQEKA